MRGMGMVSVGYANDIWGVWEWHMRGMGMASEGYGNGI